jgi:predicted signal transduction protein with EAL and GGDEF domain
VSGRFGETQLDPQYLELEITESAAVSESDYIIGVLENLKKLGVSISMTISARNTHHSADCLSCPLTASSWTCNFVSRQWPK